MKRLLAALLASCLVAGAAKAQCTTYPYALTNGNTADATQVMADFNYVVSCLSSRSSGGQVNKLRGNSLTQWYSGASSIATSGAWGSEGVYILPTGASVTVSIVANPQNGNAPYLGEKITGASGNTDVKVRFPIESYDANVLAGQTVTFQITFQNNSGASITPTLGTKYAGSQDNWGSPSIDLSATNLQACANGAICTEAYTFNASANAAKGYTPTVDFGGLGSSSNNIVIVSFDMRVTPGVTIGLNSSPPSPEISHPSDDAVWCRRFYQTNYENGVAAGTNVSSNGAGAAGLFVYGQTGTANVSATITLAPPMRAAPSISLWGLNGTTGAFTNGSSPAAGGGDFAAITASGINSRAFTVINNTTATNAMWFMYAADARIAGS